MPLCPQAAEAIVDELGQRIAHPWMGKSSAGDMAQHLRQAAKDPIPTWPQDWDAFGGITKGNEDSTGRFRLVKMMKDDTG